MRPDIDLEFLQNCTNADLRTLCDILIKDYCCPIKVDLRNDIWLGC